MSDNESDTEEVADLSNPDVTTKYVTAAGIVNKALQLVIDGCRVDADIADLCELGDKYIDSECGKLYNKKPSGYAEGKDKKDSGKPQKKMEKGIAFPTCVSVNDTVGHFSPLKADSKKLEKGDVAKIDMACHIDGFVAAAAHTVVVGAEGEVKDRKADVILSAWNAAEAALRLVQKGNKNTQVTEMVVKSAEAFKCTPMQGVLSHQMKKHVIDGNQVIMMSKETADEKVEEFEFDTNEVYCIDVVVSSGEGRGKETDIRTTVFKRDVEMQYNLKTQKARQFISEVNKRFPTLPFTMRAFEDEQMARVGVSEAKRHELIHEYPVLREREGEFVAQFKFTVLLLPGGTKRITTVPFAQQGLMKSEYQIEDEELKKLLATSANPKKAKKKKKEGKDGEDA